MGCRRANREQLTKRSSVPVRDETGRFVGVRPKTPAERLQAQVRPGLGLPVAIKNCAAAPVLGCATRTETVKLH
jgi:hypothetical protein